MLAPPHAGAKGQSGSLWDMKSSAHGLVVRVQPEPVHWYHMPNALRVNILPDCATRSSTPVPLPACVPFKRMMLPANVFSPNVHVPSDVVRKPEPSMIPEPSGERVV